MKKLLLLFAAFILVLPSFAANPSLTKKEPTKVPKFEDFKNEKALERWNNPVAKRQGAKSSVSPFAKLPKANAEAVAAAENFKCALLSSDKWDDDDEQYGAYSFSSSDIDSFTRLYLNTAAPANAGGFFTTDKYYFTYYEAETYGDDYTVTTYVVNTSSWKLEKTIDQDSRYAMAYDLAYDPIEGVAFGAFYDGSEGSSYWGYMDLSDGTVYEIAQLDGILVAVAINNQGEVYAITDAGVLVSVGKYTGELTAIGRTGLTPSSSVRQSAAFAENGTLYWSVGQYSSSYGYATGLVTVDLSTGAASLVGQYADYEDVVALYCEPTAADPGAPANASNLALNFVDDALTGTISFDVPNVDNEGNTITGSVGYIINIDGSDAVSGTTNVGETASVEVSVQSAGVHTFAVKLKNDKGLSQRVAISQWVGIDRPVAVADLTLSKTGDTEATLTWTAPTKGALDGFFSADRLNYKVTRLSDNKVVAEKLTDTKFVDNLSLDVQTYITYRVTAYADDAEGASATSNGVVFGPAFDTPVTFDFLNESDYNIFTVIDNNETVNLDSGKWQYSPSGECAGYVCGTKDGDDWLISPDINLKADRQYTISYDVLCYSNYWPDNYALYMGQGATIEAMKTQLQPNTQIYWDEYRTNTIVFTVPEDGVYNFGFQALSEAGGAFFIVDNIKVADSYMLKAPQAVTDLNVTADAQGANSVSITFTLPTKAVDGSDLSELAGVKIYRNYVVYDQIGHPSPGAKISYTDDRAPDENVVYSVAALTDAGEGPQESQNVWVGLDIPAEPTVHMAVNSDGNPVISWDAPASRGQHDGYVKTEDLTYIVYRVLDGEILAQNLINKSFVDEEVIITNEGEQYLQQYGVFAVNSKGTGYPGTNFIIEGEKYKLPYNESFANGKSSSLVLVSSTITGTDGYDAWAIDADYNVDSQDSDGGSMLMLPATVNSQSTIQMGKIDMANAKNSVFSFYFKRLDYDNDFPETNPEDDQLEVYIGGADYETKLVKTVRPVDLAKVNTYERFEVPLTDYEGTDFIYLQFKMNIGAAYYAVALDNITVRSNYDTNLLLSSVDLPASVDVTKEFTANVSVLNDGQKDVGAYTVAIKAGDQVLDTKSAESLKTGATQKFEFSLTALSTWANEQTLTAEVTIDGDECEADNTAEAVLNIVRPQMQTVTDLAVAEGDYEATFTWSPVSISDTQQIVESFESYDNFAKNTGSVGGWTMIDNDGNWGVEADVYVTAYWGYRAFTVFDPEDGENGDPATWGPRTGNKSAIAFPNFDLDNDDWMVTPRLSGKAQTISFWARGNNVGTDAIIVYYTTEETPTVAAFKSAKKLSDREIDLNAEWTQYSFDVPEGALYFAIRYYVDNGGGCLVDDVEFEQAAVYNVTPEVLGYNLYHYGKKVNDELITTTSYYVSGQVYGPYYVTVVYNVGESERSNIVSVTTAVRDITVDSDDDANQPTYDVYGRPAYNLIEGQLYIRKGQKFIYRK